MVAAYLWQRCPRAARAAMRVHGAAALECTQRFEDEDIEGYGGGYHQGEGREEQIREAHLRTSIKRKTNISGVRRTH